MSLSFRLEKKSETMCEGGRLGKLGKKRGGAGHGGLAREQDPEKGAHWLSLTVRPMTELEVRREEDEKKRVLNGSTSGGVVPMLTCLARRDGKK